MDSTRFYTFPLYIAILISWIVTDGVHGDATVSLEFVRYENTEGTGNNGHCCDGKWGLCQNNGCDHMFTICLDSVTSGNSVKDCPYGRSKSKAINNQDVITFGTKIANLPNPTNYHVRGPLPPILKLKVNVEDKDMITSDFVDLLISDIHLSERTDKMVLMKARTSLKVQVQVKCANNFYGEHCDIVCNPGHNYECDQMTGQKVCKQGFSGKNCADGVCSKFPCHHGGWCSVTSAGTPKCVCPEGYIGVHCDTNAAHINDCDDINNDPKYKDKSGVYEIRPSGSPISFYVYCEMQDGRGWTVLQRRLDGSVDFNRNWTEYESGFGQLGPDTEFWLGLEKMHYLTYQRGKKYKLRIDMEDHFGEQRYAEYGQFAIENENYRYKLYVAGYHGNAGDGLSSKGYGDPLASDKEKFSTYDRDNDNVNQFNCAQRYSAGWWYHGCSRTNLNGPYLPQDKGWSAVDCESTADRCIAWQGEQNPGSLRKVQMMAIRA